MFGQLNLTHMNLLLSRIVALIILFLGISACKPTESGFRMPNRDEINAFIKEKGITLIVDKMLADSSVLLYESDTSFGYYLPSVHEPEGTLSVKGASSEKSGEPIMVFEQLKEGKPFIAVIIQDKTLLAEAAAVEVAVNPYNTLSSTTDGKAGVVLISPTQMKEWEIVTLYNSQGGVVYNKENRSIQQLRVMNSGKEDIDNLVILFPGHTADSEALRVGFGNIPAGEVTGYRSVPNGVYRYAAYEYMSNGRLVEQPVMDWVGESSLQGEKFTYRIELDLNKEPGGQIQLIKVLVDWP